MIVPFLMPESLHNQFLAFGKLSSVGFASIVVV